MPRVICRKYSTFYDAKNGVQFSPIVDVSKQCYVGLAVVEGDLVEIYEGRDGFDVVTDEEYLAIINPAPKAAAATASETATGTPAAADGGAAQQDDPLDPPSAKPAAS
ncbi:MAG: hypothetical protein P4L33_10605 [Capsulimonadaceae bacterium]|nr:hypothetical protein [Capsulimonadaceae bacterium]